MIREKEDPVVTDAPTETPFPFLAVQSLHIALEGIGFHLREYPRNALLNGFGELAKVLLCIFG
jgi:hypothetical protein